MKKFFGLLAATVAAGTLTCFAGSAQALNIVQESEPNNSFATADVFDLNAGNFFNASLAGSQLDGTLDFWQTTLDPGTFFVSLDFGFSTQPQAAPQPYVGLFVDSGSGPVELVTKQAVAGVASTVEFNVTQGGTYFIAVGADENFSTGSTNLISYTIDVTAQPIPEPTTMLGLSVAGALGFVAKRKRKQETAV